MSSNFRFRSGKTEDVPPYVYRSDGTRVNLYENPNEYLSAIGLSASRPVTVEQARLAVHQMAAARDRANSGSVQHVIGSSFNVTDGNAPPANRTVRITMRHIEPSLRYANATGDLSPLEGLTDIVTDGTSVGIDVTGQGHFYDGTRFISATGMTRGFGGMAAAKAELQVRDAAAQAYGRERAAENVATGNVIER